MSNSDLLNYWLKSTPEYVFFKNAEGQYINTSQSNVELAGLSSASDMIGKYDYEIYPPEIAQKFLIQDKKVIETGKPLYDITWIDHPKLGRMQLKCFKAPMFDDFRNVIGIYGISIDITDKFRMRKKIEQQKAKTQTILDNIPAAIWIKNSNNKYITVNHAYEKFYKLNKTDIIGQNVRFILQRKRLFTENDLELLSLQDLEVMKYKKTKTLNLWTNESTKRRFVTISKSPLVKGDGTCVGLIGFSHEIKAYNEDNIV